MKRLAKLALVLVVAVLALTFVLTACEEFEWGPVGDCDPKAQVSGNGSVAVAQGNTVYFVNGKADLSAITVAEDNWFGKAGYKGSIMKGTLKEDGSVAGAEVVVPKMFYNGQADGGLYVFGNWIYYTSPSTDTNSEGTVLTSRQVFFRTKTDGTDTQQIAAVAANTYEYLFTPSGLFYYDSSNGQIVKVAYSESAVGASSVIAEDVTDVMFVKDGEYTYGESRSSDMFFYTKAGDTENDADVLYGNRVYACNYEGKSVLLIDKTTYVPEGAVAAQYQYTVTLLDYTIEDGGVALFYSRTPGSSSVSLARTATAAYKVTPAAIAEGGEGAILDAAAERVLAYSALSSVTAVSFDYGVLQADSSNALYRYYCENDAPVKKCLTVDEKGEPAAMEGTPTILAVRDEEANASNNNVAGKYLYYTVSSVLYKLNLDNGSALGSIMDSTQETVSTDYISASFITRTVENKTVDYLFFDNGVAANYTSVVALSSLNYAVEGGEWMIKSVLASGYWTVGEEGCPDKNYAVDEEGIYTLTDPEDSSATVQTTRPLPKYMEEKDKATYISAYGA